MLLALCRPVLCKTSFGSRTKPEKNAPFGIGVDTVVRLHFVFQKFHIITFTEGHLAEKSAIVVHGLM
jgi:hypothetical protein